MTAILASPRLERRRAVSGPRLNVGCGPVQPDGWVNIDGSNRARLASRLPWLDHLLVACGVLPPTEFSPRTTVLDVRAGLPYADDSVAVVFCGEMLEHLTREEGARFLAEAFRVLRPGGVLRVRVPDNYQLWKNYVAACERMRDRPPEEWDDRHTRWVELFFRDICVRNPGLRSMGHYHKWMYDEVSLTLAFRRAGFADVARCELHESRIPDVEQVEVANDLLIVEGVKPERDS